MTKKPTKTKKGREHSHFTLVCNFESTKFRNNPVFTYRGDDQLTNYKSQGKVFTNEIRVLEFIAEKIAIFNSLKMVLYDNSFKEPNNVYKLWANKELVIDNSDLYKIENRKCYRNIDGILNRSSMEFIEILGSEEEVKQPEVKSVRSDEVHPNILEQIKKNIDKIKKATDEDSFLQNRN